METVTVPRGSVWLARLWGRNALVRGTDRFEAFLMTAAVAIAVLLVPFAAALATVSHESLSRTYSQQAQERREVTARVVDSPRIAVERTQLIVVAPLAWRVDGVERRAVTEVDASLRIGDPVDIWVDRMGARTQAPPPAWRAGAEAVVLAAAAWATGAGVLASVTALLRAGLRGRRDRRWDRDLRRLTSVDEGRADSQS